MKTWCRGALALRCLLAFSLIPTSLLAEPVTLKRVVELALSHATGSAISAADEQKVAASYRELRDSYIPQITTGAGLGFSYGFPLSLEGAAPALFNVTAQSALLNASLHDFIRATKVESKVASLNSKDQRNQIIQDAAQNWRSGSSGWSNCNKTRRTQENFRQRWPNASRKEWTRNWMEPRRGFRWLK